MIYWAKAVEDAISKNNLAGLFDVLNKQMTDVTKLIRNRTEFLESRILSFLLVLDVVENIPKIKVDSGGAFELMSILRYYWEKGIAILMMLA
jgi:hypothetical protein